MNIEKCLREYREKTARIAILVLGISGLRDEINYSTGIIETQGETIEGMTFRRSEGGGSNEISSKTERVALKFRDEQDKLGKPVSVSSLYQEIRDREGEKKRLLEEIDPMKIAIEGLSDKEKLIIKEFYINNNSWYTVSVRYQQICGYPVTKDTCRKIKSGAFVKLKRILGVE